MIEHDGCKIIIDFGSNLPGCKQEEFTKNDIDELTAGTNAIFYTHYHEDHVGLHHLINENIPQYIGTGAKDVMLCKYKALGKHLDMTLQKRATENMLTYTAENTIDFPGCDKIKVTPYYVSHSAFDAYMFLIECDEIKILHTGDFRKHGYLGKGLFPTLNKYVGNVDILITEGTMLGRKQETVVREVDIKRKVVEALKQHRYVFALCSSTDLDRLASFHAACKETGREFFVDNYQKDVLNAFTNHAGEKSSLFKFDKTFSLIKYDAANVVKHLKHTGFLMPIRSGMEYLAKGIMNVYNDEEPWLIYSMWSGYAQEGKDYTNEKVVNIRNLFGNRILDGTHDGYHTSGHADLETLADVCAIVKPRLGVIPIHKDASTQYDMDKVKKYHIITSSEKISKNANIIIK